MKSALRLAGILLICGLCGCESGPGDSGLPMGGSNVPGAGTPGTPVNNEQRVAVFDSVATTLAGMRADEPDAARTALLALLQQNTAIEATGVSEDGSLWARFTDNRLIIIAMNNPTPTAQDAPLPNIPQDKLRIDDPIETTNAAVQTARPKKPLTSLDALVTFPKSTDFFLFNGYHDDYAGVETHLSNLASWLSLHGYTDKAPFGRAATITNLKAVKNAGLVYVHAHGGTGYVRQSSDPNSPVVPVYGLGTVSFRTANGSTDVLFEDLLMTNQVGYLITPSVFEDGIEKVLKYKTIASPGYFITKEFVLNQWTFKPGAWVYMDVCKSADAGFRDACITVGAGVYLGWDLGVRHVDAQETSEYMFSRLLGINSLQGAKYARAETVPQRPFPLDALYEDIDQRQRTAAPDIPGTSSTLRTSVSRFNLPDVFTHLSLVAHLQATRVENVIDPMLLPTIQQLFIDDQESLVYNDTGILVVGGSFGIELEQQRVIVGGQEAQIIQNGQNNIICKLTGTMHGPVVVGVENHLSPPRMLTHWKGFAGSLISRDDPGPVDSLNMAIRFRGDVQSVRTKPGETPIYRGIPTFDAIPETATILNAEEFGMAPCPQNQSGAGSKWVTPGFGTLPVKRSGSTGDYMWFQKGGNGAVVDEDTGTITGTVAFGVVKADAVHVTVDCQFLPPVDRFEEFNLSGGVDVEMTRGHYNIDATFTQDLPPLHFFSDLKMTAESTPSEDDLR